VDGMTVACPMEIDDTREGQLRGEEAPLNTAALESCV
jgi:hypothetical protein